MSAEWIQRGSVWLFRIDGLTTNYVRLSETGGEYLDLRGRLLGKDLEAAKREVEQRHAVYETNRKQHLELTRKANERYKRR